MLWATTYPPTRPPARGAESAFCCTIKPMPRPEERGPMPSDDRFSPTRDHRFSFGLWTVGWQGVDVFGGPIRPVLDPAEAIQRLSDLGAYGITFHDNDVFPFGADAASREQHLAPFRKALE